MKRLSIALAASLLAVSALSARAEPVTLEVWTIPQPDYAKAMIAGFEKENPDIKLNLKIIQFPDVVNDLARAAATGGGPDIAYVDNPDIALLASKKVLLDLKPMIDASKVIKTADIFPGPLEAVTYEGGIYGVPRGANTIALFYNADMFKAKGLDPDKPPQTWEELYSAAKTLNDPGKNVYGLAFSAVGTEEGTFQFLPWLQMGGGDYKKVNGEAGVKALDFWKRILDNKLASPDTLIRGQYDSTGTFVTGNAAMAISGPWELPRMSKEAKFDYRAALLPVPHEGAPRASALGEGDNVILAGSKNQEAAFRYIEYCYSQMPFVWNEFGYLPASKVEVKDPNHPKIFAVFEESMKFSRTRGPSPEWPQISKAIYTAIQASLTNQESSQAALDTAQATIDRILSR